MPEIIYCCEHDYQVSENGKVLPEAKLYGAIYKIQQCDIVFLHEQDIEDVEDLFEQDSSYIRLRTIFYHEYNCIVFTISPSKRLIVLCDDYEAIASAVELKNRLS